MISRILTRGVLPAVRLCSPVSLCFTAPKFNFSKIQLSSQIHQIIEEEIRVETENINDLSAYDAAFNERGWTITKENTLVELYKEIGPYKVRLISNIKSPSKLDDQENNEQQENNEEEQDFDTEMNEITICVTRTGSEKTMIIQTIVAEGFQITNIHFTPNYETAKNSRFDFLATNSYTGPELETLSEELFESIYRFINEELEVTNELMEGFAEYCLQGEQSFKIDWLKDLKSII